MGKGWLPERDVTELTRYFNDAEADVGGIRCAIKQGGGGGRYVVLPGDDKDPAPVTFEDRMPSDYQVRAAASARATEAVLGRLAPEHARALRDVLGPKPPGYRALHDLFATERASHAAVAFLTLRCPLVVARATRVAEAEERARLDALARGAARGAVVGDARARRWRPWHQMKAKDQHGKPILDREGNPILVPRPPPKKLKPVDELAVGVAAEAAAVAAAARVPAQPTLPPQVLEAAIVEVLIAAGRKRGREREFFDRVCAWAVEHRDAAGAAWLAAKAELRKAPKAKKDIRRERFEKRRAVLERFDAFLRGEGPDNALDEEPCAA